MALAYNTLRDMPRLRTYADANRREMETKPIRGDKDNTKPLGKRSQKWRHIKREDNNDICIYVGGDVLIRFRPNDDVLIYDIGYWNKATYNDIIGEVLGIHVETFDRQMWAHVNGGKMLLRPNPRRFWDTTINDWKMEDKPIPENIFRWEPNPDSLFYPYRWVYTNPPGLMRHTIKRKAMREVRARYKNFIDYAKAMASLRKDNRPKPEEYKDYFDLKPSVSMRPDGTTQPHYAWHTEGMPTNVYSNNFTHNNALELAGLMQSADATDNYKAFLWLGEVRYHGNDNIENAIDRVIIKRHYTEVLTLTEAPAGKQVKDKYAWAKR